MAGERVVYDWYKTTQVAHDDDRGGQVVTTSEASHGEWPSCLPEDWKTGLPNSNPSVFTERKCDCGKHIVYCLEVPKSVWPHDHQIRVRVVEIATE